MYKVFYTIAMVLFVTALGLFTAAFLAELNTAGNLGLVAILGAIGFVIAGSVADG
jgi:hypothetical protein